MEPTVPYKARKEEKEMEWKNILGSPITTIMGVIVFVALGFLWSGKITPEGFSTVIGTLVTIKLVLSKD